MSFSSLTKEDVGKVITSIAKVKEVFQTAGPTIFTLFDGTTTLPAKAFLKPGKRAFPEINKEDVVSVKLKLQEYEGDIESEIIEIEKTDSQAFQDQIEEFNAEKVKVTVIPFRINSEALAKLQPKFIQAASLIKQSIYDRRPIILRHNADCDGYSGAVAIERAILPLISDLHGDDYNRWRYYKRAPSRAPYYGFADSLMDLAGAVNDMSRYNEKPPLIIILDNGAARGDLPGIRNVKSYECPVIVMDHHPYDDAINAVVDVHINPHLVGYSSLTASMLGTELARFINPNVEKIDFLAALGGTGDKSKSTEMEQYLALAKLAGYDKDYLKKLSLTIDFIAYYLRSVEAHSLIQDILGNNQEVQLRTVDLFYNEALSRKAQLIESAKHYADIRELDGKTLALIDLDKLSSCDFPAYGKMTGMISDWLNETYQRVYVIGIANDMAVIRVSQNEPFSIHDIITQLSSLAYAGISGGGHDKAGTIKFLPAAKEEIIGFIEEYISKIK